MHARTLPDPPRALDVLPDAHLHFGIARALCFIALLVTAPLYAGAFEFRWLGARSAGIGGACVAAADPTAVACNPGALALMPKKKGAAAGLALSGFNQSLYQGLSPGIGAGTAAEQETPLGIIPHAFITLPFPLLGPNSVLGTGIHYPYRMHTEWTEPDEFAGRFLATESEVEAWDFTTALSTRIGSSVGVGAGVTYRSSNMSVSRRFAANVSGGPREIASLSMETDVVRTLVWSAGVLFKPGPSFSAGFTYESGTDAEYGGVGTLTQIATGDAQFDQLIRASFPFDEDLPISSRLQFPPRSAFGVAWTPSKAWLFAFDASRTHWRQTSDIEIEFPSNHALDTQYPLAFEDVWSYRTGVRFRFPTGPQLRLGYALDKSPQPDSTVGAFLPDADRTTITTGFGLDWLDIAVGWTTHSQRIVRTNADDFNGNYRADSWFAMLTVTK